MKPLIIKETDISPGVVFDISKRILEVKGTCRPENAIEFYEPVFNWLNAFHVHLSEQTKITEKLSFVFFFDYLNSVSTKLLFDSFKILQKAHSSNTPIQVIWRYHKGDTDMKETGEEYKKLLNFPFEVLAE